MGLSLGVNLDCLSLEESARIKRAALDLNRLIYASGFKTGGVETVRWIHWK